MGMSAAQIQPLAEQLWTIFLANPTRHPPALEFSNMVQTIRDEGYSDEIIVAMIWKQEPKDAQPRTNSNSEQEWSDLLDMVEHV